MTLVLERAVSGNQCHEKRVFWVQIHKIGVMNDAVIRSWCYYEGSIHAKYQVTYSQQKGTRILIQEALSGWRNWWKGNNFLCWSGFLSSTFTKFLSMYHQEETRYGMFLEFWQIIWSAGCLGVVEVFASRWACPRGGAAEWTNNSAIQRKYLTFRAIFMGGHKLVPILGRPLTTQ